MNALEKGWKWISGTMNMKRNLKLVEPPSTKVHVSFAVLTQILHN